MQRTINTLSKELNLPEEVVWKTYKAYWLFIRKTIEEFPLKDLLSEEDFHKLRLNFNIPNLGKLYCTYDRYIGIKNRQKILKNAKHKKDKTNG